MPEEVPTYEEYVNKVNDLSSYQDDLDRALDALRIRVQERETAVNNELQDLRSWVSSVEDRVLALENGTSPEPEPEPTPTGTVVGSSVGFKAGYTYPQLISEFEDLTGGFDVRRSYDSDTPPSFDRSSLQYDHGDRMQAWSFKPGASTTVSQVQDLFDSIPDPSKVWVIPYHEPVDNMDAQEYRRRYNIVYEAYRRNGRFAGIGPCLTNFSIKHRGALEYVQPDKTTFLSVDYYADLAHNTTPFPHPVSEMREAIEYANQHDLGFAVDEFGVDRRNTHRTGAHVEWINGFKDLGNEVELLRLCWWNQDIDVIACRLEHADPRILEAWKSLRDFYA